MMRISAEVGDRVNLLDEFYRGFDSYNLEFSPPLTRPQRLWLVRNHSDGIFVECAMHDIGPQWEAGVLAFSSAAAMLPGEMTFHALPAEWRSIRQVFRLEMIEQPPPAQWADRDPVVVESGMVLQSSVGNEITIVAGAAPFSVEVSAPFLSNDFEPQYALSSYRRVRMNPRV